MEALLRKTIYLKEALFFSIIFTLIDAICFYRVQSMNILTKFDNNIWNLVVTLTSTLLILLISTYSLDYLVTEITLKRIEKKNKVIRKMQGD